MHISEYILQEIKRKAFHVLGIFFPILYYFINKIFICIILFILTIIIIYIDNIRHTNIQLQSLIEKYFNSIMRSQERSGTKNLSGVSYFMTGMLLTALCFSKELAITSWMILIIADSAAALTGKIIGTTYIGSKSIEGSIAFFVMTVMISILMFGLLGYPSLFSALLGTALIVTFVELYSEKININDNFTIPISYCLSILLLNYLLS